MSLPMGLDLNSSISQDRKSTKVSATLKDMSANEFKDFMDGKQINTNIKKPMNLFSEMKNQLKKSEPLKKSKIKPRKNGFIPSVQEIKRMLKLIKKKSRSREKVK